MGTRAPVRRVFIVPEPDWLTKKIQLPDKVEDPGPREPVIAEPLRVPELVTARGAEYHVK